MAENTVDNDAVNLPLLTESGVGLNTPNLKRRFSQELTKFYTDTKANWQSRGNLSIENQEIASIREMAKGTMACIDKLGIGDDIKPEEYPTTTDWKYLAQYLSWSYFNATEHDIADREFKPGDKVLGQMQRLFVGIKAMIDNSTKMD